MLCKNCGKEIQEDVSFCPHCGAKVEKADNASATSESFNTVENVNPNNPVYTFESSSLDFGFGKAGKITVSIFSNRIEIQKKSGDIITFLFSDISKVSIMFTSIIIRQSLQGVYQRAKALMDKSVAEMKNGRSFQLMAKTYGTQKLREVLASSDPQVASMALYAPPKEQRYALDEQTKQRLRALGASMQTEKRSNEWKALREALTDPKMKDSSKIFDAVEKYTKGKKSVRMTQAGRDSFDLAMTALAIAAKKGDPAAKQRAQNLVDRVNEVRGAQNAKHKNHVSLDAYAPKKSNEPKRKMTEPQKTEPEA